MGFKLKFISVVSILCLMAMQGPSDCVARYGCNYAEAVSFLEIQSRKLLAGLEVKHGFYDENLAAREMRMVPSGPDPLHHNGGSPKKPRTP